MRPGYSNITPTHIYHYATTVLQPYLQWHDRGPKCTVKTLLHVLFYAAAQLCSVFAACSRLRDAPSDQAMRWSRCVPIPCLWNSSSIAASLLNSPSTCANAARVWRLT
jgi:hypothetical protein